MQNETSASDTGWNISGQKKKQIPLLPLGGQRRAKRLLLIDSPLQTSLALSLIQAVSPNVLPFGNSE